MLADRKYPLSLAGLFGLYVLAGKLGLSLASVHASASPVWPPTGVALAAFLTLGYRVWPAVFAGAFVVNITTAGSLPTSLAISLGNTLEGGLGAYLVMRYANGAHAFDHAQDVFKFAALAGLAASLVSATIGVGSLALGGYASWADIDSIWLTWWLGDATGALIFAPLLVLLVRDWGAGPAHGRLLEAAALWLTTTLVGLAVFGEGLAHLGFMTLPLTFLCTPPLVWAAVRFRQREAAMLVAVLSGIAVWETLHGFGPLANVPTNESLLLLQVFMATVSVMAISAGAVVEERRRIEHEREFLLIRAQAARAEAEAANRGKDEFLAMLGHELRNPLAAIISAVSVLDRIGGQDDVAVRAREAIRHQITHLGRLVDDLLDIVHVTTGEIALSRKPLNLATSVQRSVGELASTGRLERHVVDVRAEPVWANADPTRLNQIVSNLLLNAIKYTSPGGTIRVRVIGQEGLAVIGVSDTGIGIPSKLLPHMFEPPPQGDRRLLHAQDGLGVGLTLVRRLVELHGGQVEAYSEGPGHGSEFLVRLPRIAPVKPTESQSVLRVIGKVASVRH
ncbi:MAG TPA: MASE1 domain-containing protein [Methylomirabilota bacterium]|nr:MASE1 domain-containing protein [Methylomirabilota bacterium]